MNLFGVGCMDYVIVHNFPSLKLVTVTYEIYIPEGCQFLSLYLCDVLMCIIWYRSETRR
jgi:hypothetical protein